MLSGAQPLALSRYARAALAMDDELSISCRRLASSMPSLAADVASFARGCAALDRWVGRVGSSFEAADSPGPSWVDHLSDGEATSLVLSLGGRFGPSLRFLTSAERDELRLAFFPLAVRVRALYPSAFVSAPCAARPRRRADVDSALETLDFPDRSRRADVVTGFLDGLLLGAFDERGYDNGWGEGARVVGHLTSGFFVAGDIRDLAADIAHADALAAVFDIAALVPVAGDLFKVGKEGFKAANAVHDTERAVVDLAEHEALGGHVRSLHVGKTDAELARRLLDEPRIPAASSFADEAVAGRTISGAIDAHAGEIATWLAGDNRQLTIPASVRDPIGRVWPRGAAAPTEATRIRLILRRSPTAADGYYVHTVVLDP
jgi:hypothetical protein